MTEFYEFLSMSGYAYYVWSAYGISLLVLLLSIVIPMKREKTFLNKLRKLRSESR